MKEYCKINGCCAGYDVADCADCPNKPKEKQVKSKQLYCPDEYGGCRGVGCNDCPKSNVSKEKEMLGMSLCKSGKICKEVGNVSGRFYPQFHRWNVSPKASGGYYASQVCKIYGWPTGVAGNPFTIALIELGGGYNSTNIVNHFTKVGLPVPNIKVVSVDGATNSYSGNPNSADVEVELDIVCAAEAYSYMTGQAANIEVYFAPNTDQGFVDTVNMVAKRGNCICSISWGSYEGSWNTSSIAAMDAGFFAGNNNGVTWTVASGDSGSSDGGRGNNVDYPASSPYVVGCGGTTLLPNGNESVWNAGGGAGGGGISVVEKVPAYQNGFVTGQFRGVPDVCGDADPSTGYITTIWGTIGGTSAVAPLMAGYFASVCVKTGKPLGNVNTLLYPNESAFVDVTAGNNGAWSATKGYDEASGLGRATASLWNILVGNTTNPPIPTPTPTPTPVPTPIPTSPPVQSGPTLADAVGVVDTECKLVESQIAYRYRPLVEYLRLQIDSALGKLWASHTALSKFKE